MEQQETLFSLEFHKINHLLNEKSRKNEALLSLRSEARRIDELYAGEVERMRGKRRKADAAVASANTQSRELLVDVVQHCDKLSEFVDSNCAALRRLVERFDWLVEGEVASNAVDALQLSFANNGPDVLRETKAWAVQTFASTFCAGDIDSAISIIEDMMSKRRAGDAMGWLGFFAGGTATLLVTLCLSLAWSDLMSHPLWHPSHRIFRAFLLLAMYFYFMAAVTWVCNLRSIDYPFIFGIDKTRFLRPRHYALIASQIAFVTLAGANFFLFQIRLEAPSVSTNAKYWILVTAILLLLYLINPIKIGHRSARSWFLRTLGRIVTAPLFPLQFRDFWLGDQLTSMVVILGDLGYGVCYFTVDFHADTAVCVDENIPYLRSIFALLPFFFRFMQCLRRYYDFRLVRDLINAGKYLSSLLLVTMALLHTELDINEWGTFRIVWVVIAVTATLYGFTWDIMMDWGIGRPQFCCLRRNVILPKPSYYVAMPVNFVLRCAWLFTVTPRLFEGNVYQKALEFSLAGGELLRRCNWNVFRLANEHTQIQLQLRVNADELPVDTFTQETQKKPISLREAISDPFSLMSTDDEDKAIAQRGQDGANEDFD